MHFTLFLSFTFWQFFANKKRLLKKHQKGKMTAHCTTPFVQFCEIDGLTKIHKMTLPFF
jgi:hypothetical protein